MNKFAEHIKGQISKSAATVKELEELAKKYEEDLRGLGYTNMQVDPYFAYGQYGFYFNFMREDGKPGQKFTGLDTKNNTKLNLRNAYYDLINRKNWYLKRQTNTKNASAKKATVGYNAKPENLSEEMAIDLAEELDSAASLALEKAGLFWGGYSGEKERKERVEVAKEALKPLITNNLKKNIDEKFYDLVIEHLTDINSHIVVSAIEEIMKDKQASKCAKVTKKARVNFSEIAHLPPTDDTIVDWLVDVYEIDKDKVIELAKNSKNSSELSMKVFEEEKKQKEEHGKTLAEQLEKDFTNSQSWMKFKEKLSENIENGKLEGIIDNYKYRVRYNLSCDGDLNTATPKIKNELLETMGALILDLFNRGYFMLPSGDISNAMTITIATDDGFSRKDLLSICSEDILEKDGRVIYAYVDVSIDLELERIGEKKNSSKAKKMTKKAESYQNNPHYHRGYYDGITAFKSGHYPDASVARHRLELRLRQEQREKYGEEAAMAYITGFDNGYSEAYSRKYYKEMQKNNSDKLANIIRKEINKSAGSIDYEVMMDIPQNSNVTKEEIIDEIQHLGDTYNLGLDDMYDFQPNHTITFTLPMEKANKLISELENLGFRLLRREKKDNRTQYEWEKDQKIYD